MGGMGGAGGGSACEDDTSKSEVGIMTSGITWDPSCIMIKTGTKVTWTANFVVHPLVGGTVENGMKKPDPSSPIPTTNMGSAVSVTFDKAGTYPYYCDMHGLAGMTGKVIVQ
jgi:plastocyanin